MNSALSSTKKPFSMKRLVKLVKSGELSAAENCP